MIKLIDKSKVPFYDYFYLLCIIIYAGQASALVRQLGDIRTIGNAIGLILTFIFAIKKHVKFDVSLFGVIGIFSVYCILVTLVTNSFYYLLWEYSRWVIYFFIAYVICKGYGREFFVIAETIIYHLCIIGLICWVLLLLIPHQFTSFISSISLQWYNDNERFLSYNALFYTISIFTVEEGLGQFDLIARNAGFAWEPGGFACFICFGLFFNMLRTNFQLRDNLAFFVFLLALLSTQSTTGYVSFGVMFLIWLIINKKFFWAILVVPILLLMLRLPFLGDKLSVRTEGFSNLSMDSIAYGDSFDRLLSFKLFWLEFLRHPVLGYGFSQSWIDQHEIATFSGIGQLLAQYGAIMTIVFISLLIKTAKKLNVFFKSNCGILLLIAMIGMMISYRIWSQPFFIAIWLSCLFMKQAENNPIILTNTNCNFSIIDK